MKPVGDGINQIKWDEKLREEDYTSDYWDFGRASPS